MTLIEQAIEMPLTPKHKFSDLLKELNGIELTLSKNKLIKKQKDGCKVNGKLSLIAKEQKRRKELRLEETGKSAEAKMLAKAENRLRLIRQEENQEVSIHKRTSKNIKIGDKVNHKTELDSQKNDKTRKGVVIYIHPKKYWYMLEFQLKGGKVRECYQM